ncbi:MAG TPA: PH domain-containing protein [Galbitalea sp.]|jgi:hypothetical protein
MPIGFQDASFYSRGGRGLTIFALAIGVLGTVAFVINQGVIAGFITAVVVVVVVPGLYLLLWRPRLDVLDSGIVIVNPLSTHRLDWAAIRAVNMRWALTIYLEKGRTITVWAVPRPSKGFDAVGMRLDPYKLPDYQAQKQHEEQDFGGRVDNAALRVIQSRLDGARG